MIDKELLQSYPTKRIKPIDGLSVTAEVWNEAHEYHRMRLRYHDLIAHGTGIVSGLEVIASDPADSQVYIMPGVAIGPSGDEIALTEAVAYDLGKAQDMLYLLLTYGESKPAADAGSADSARLYVYSGFEVEAKPELPGGPYIELARIRRTKKDSPITDAADPKHPGINQIDQRYRRMTCDAGKPIVSISVCYMGGISDKGHSKGIDYLASAASRSGDFHVCVDDGIAISQGIGSYTLVHLVGQDKFQISPDDMTAIYNYLQAGGTVFIESSRSSIASGEPAADAVFNDLLNSFGIQLRDVSGDHELLSTPNLFGQFPAGFETQGKPRLQAGGGVVLSTYDYANVWQGIRRGGPASREDIRSAHEFGVNLLAYAAGRQRTATKVK